MEIGQRRLLHTMLEARFQSLSPEAERRLNEWPADKLEELGRALVGAQSLRELGLEE
jgi:hypothetical protein